VRKNTNMKSAGFVNNLIMLINQFLKI